MAARQVRALLMGGQACVFYGAAEFSRDTDLLVLADSENVERLAAVFKELEAECIALPPFEPQFLQRGHGVHFRCRHADAANMRVDLMSRLRGVDPFPALWERRTTITEADGTAYELISLPDLVLAKKTQRDKDWPMLRRLLEAHYLEHRLAPTMEQQRFWLRELRTTQLLLEASERAPNLAGEMSALRPLLKLALDGKIASLEEALASEEREERERDRIYWEPLKLELDQLRRGRREKQ